MFLVLFAILLAWLSYEFYWKRRNLPPGPLPMPLFGNMISFFWHSPGYTFFEKCKRDYGKIYTIWMGTKPYVCISDFDLMKETFVKDGESYIGKTDMGMNKEFRGGNYGIIESMGDLWRDHRRFALHQMRDLGLGKMKMEERIMIEVEELTKVLLDKEDVNICAEFHYHVGNVINQLLLGYRFEGERKPEFDHLMDLLKQQSGKNAVVIPILFPWTRKLPYFSGVWKKFMDFRDEFFAFFQKQIDHHVTEFDFNVEKSTDYVEAYLKEKRKREAEGDFETFSNVQLINVCFDLWSAGLGTTTTTMCWGLLYLLHHPEVQAKIHEEMDTAIGSSRPVTTADKNNLQYTQAVVNEMQRALNMVVFNIPHATTRDVEIEGYKLPKDTTVIAQVMHGMYDEKIFPNPEEFNPSRFLDENGRLKKYDEMLPFSIGKRQCPGEGLARMELFLFFANLCNRFTFTCRGELTPLKKTFANIQRPDELIKDLQATYRF